ncbi:MAG: TIGR04282 family arsenosugar biosynthesis glycosyltransferase [Pirellulaceae bacterium]
MQHLGIFAKYWEPGTVKTRLAAAIGRNRASNLYRSFLECLIERFARSGERRELCYWPKTRHEEFAELAPGDWMLRPQSDGDLGMRMHLFFTEAFREGNQRVVLIGSDSPTLPVELVHEAFERLNHHDVVLGPSEDGGYYLVGSSLRPPPIFGRIDWSTPSVWEQTVGQLQAKGCSYAQLPRWYDVDELKDLERLRLELEHLASTDRGWSDLRDAVDEALYG